MHFARLQRLNMAKVLVVEDDTFMQEALTDFLRSENHTVEMAINAKEALDRIRFYHYDLVILDWELPGGSGLDILTRTRQKLAACPVLMLTGRKSQDDRVAGFEAGADDYLCKPFSMRELRVRLQALLRRPREAADAAQTVAAQTVADRARLSYKLDSADSTLVCKNTSRKLKLLPKEFAVMELLMHHFDSFVSVENIASTVWNTELSDCEDAIRTCIKRLRQRINTELNLLFIESKRGIGYRLVEGSKEE